MSSFQWIFDNAANISMIRRPIVSQTTSRDQRIRAISRGGNIWRFKVSMPTGMRWQENSSYIAQVDYANLLNPDYVNMSRAAFNYIMGYKGDSTSSLSTLNWTFSNSNNPDEFTLNGIPVMGSQLLVFRAGDFVQPVLSNSTGASGYGHVYSIAADVPYGSGGTKTVKVNRPILETRSSTYYPLNVGSQVAWKVVCTNCPTWTINPGGLVSWSGAFEFAESLL